MAQGEYGTPQYRLYRTANRYGMTVNQLTVLLTKQDSKCLICRVPIGVTSEGRAAFRIDHDPECCDNSAKANTCGKCNRGALCHRCNLYVGHIEGAIYDNLFDRILDYLGHAKNDPDYDPLKPLKD